jgi:hypothetical protein
MKLKPAEAMILTLALGLGSVSYSVTELTVYGGPGLEFVAPVAVGLAWVVSEVQSRRSPAQSDDETVEETDGSEA